MAATTSLQIKVQTQIMGATLNLNPRLLKHNKKALGPWDAHLNPGT